MSRWSCGCIVSRTSSSECLLFRLSTCIGGRGIHEAREYRTAEALLQVDQDSFCPIGSRSMS
jgi:hypothetical protein